MSEDLDLDELMDELSGRVEDLLEGAIADQVTSAVQDVLPELLQESLAAFEFVLKDGTIVRHRTQIKLLSPDKTKLLLCYGGLRVDGRTLVVQTRISSWESIAVYPSREEAAAALVKVKDAMEAGLPLLEL